MRHVSQRRRQRLACVNDRAHGVVFDLFAAHPARAGEAAPAQAQPACLRVPCRIAPSMHATNKGARGACIDSKHLACLRSTLRDPTLGCAWARAARHVWCDDAPRPRPDRTTGSFAAGSQAGAWSTCLARRMLLPEETYEGRLLLGTLYCTSLATARLVCWRRRGSYACWMNQLVVVCLCVCVCVRARGWGRGHQISRADALARLRLCCKGYNISHCPERCAQTSLNRSSGTPDVAGLGPEHL